MQIGCGNWAGHVLDHRPTKGFSVPSTVTQPGITRYAFSDVANLSVSTSAYLTSPFARLCKSIQRPYDVNIFQPPHYVNLPLQTFRFQRLISARLPSFHSPLAQEQTHSPCPKVTLALLVYSRLLPCSVRTLTKEQSQILIHAYIRAGSLQAYYPTSP